MNVDCICLGNLNYHLRFSCGTLFNILKIPLGEKACSSGFQSIVGQHFQLFDNICSISANICQYVNAQAGSPKIQARRLWNLYSTKW